MHHISSGIKGLDDLTDSFYVGDNVVWEVESGTHSSVFIRNFVTQAMHDGQHVMYISFNSSPQTIFNKLSGVMEPGRFVLVDCFTSGKGKKDRTFLKFYENLPAGLDAVLIENPKDIEAFSARLNAIEDSLPSGIRLVFDSLTGMQDLWGSEDETYHVFTYMCPRLYDLGTVAYWILENEAHSPKFKANLHHITQVVLSLFKRREKLYIKALKLEGREEREAFKPHLYEICGSDVSISMPKKEAAADIGSGIKEARLARGISQKELADKIGLTPSFLSQLENNQISPSLNSYLQICEALGVSPGYFLNNEQGREKVNWFFGSASVRARATQISDGVKRCIIAASDRGSMSMVVFVPGASMARHISDGEKPEFAHVTGGALFVTVGGKEQILTAGDSVYFSDIFPSAWRNKGGGEALVIVFA
jgi:transcriptional regulator with XRE-family HTH domain